jgi:4-amino-4-deoxy-L-arabinose transferase-like glycosyltransferase
MATATETADTNRMRLPLLVFMTGLIVSLLMVFVGWRVQQLVANGDDPYGFAAMGHSLARGEGFAAYGSVLDRRAPLYPALIAFFTLIAGENPLPVRIAQCFLAAGTCLLAFDMGRRIYNERTGLIAGLLCALHPALLRYVPDFHLETLLAFLFTLTLWTTVTFTRHPSALNGALIGITGGLAALTKPVVVLYPLLFAAWWAFLRLRERRRDPGQTLPWRSLAAIFLAMAAVILPWTYRNYRSSGHFVLITTGLGDAYLRGLIFSRTEFALLRQPPYTDAENESNALFRRLCAEQGTVWQRNDVETEQILVRESKRRFLSDPGAFVRKFVVGLFTFWYQMTTLKNSLITGLLALIAWVLALIGWGRSRREGQPAWLLFLPVLSLNLALAALLALGRYSVPVLPALTVLAAFGLDTLLPRRVATTVQAEAEERPEIYGKRPA